jgi:hypothetical protein
MIAAEKDGEQLGPKQNIDGVLVPTAELTDAVERVVVGKSLGPTVLRIELSGTAIPWLPGDANIDGTVDLVDLAVVLTNFDKSDMTWSQEDFSGDGSLGIDDLSKLLFNCRSRPKREPLSRRECAGSVVAQWLARCNTRALGLNSDYDGHGRGISRKTKESRAITGCSEHATITFRGLDLSLRDRYRR